MEMGTADKGVLFAGFYLLSPSLLLPPLSLSLSLSLDHHISLVAGEAMAVALEGFSIRGYVGKMRTVDFNKCWPFDGDGLDQSKGGELTPSLPPISIRNYRWWSDELEPAQSGKEESEKAGTSEQLMPDLKPERCPTARNPNKGKQRAPKKRSIVEIFAVAPQVEAIDDDDKPDDDETDEREQRGDVDEDGLQDEEHEEQIKENGSGDGDHEGGGSDGAAPEATTRKTTDRAKGDKKKEMLRRKIWMKYKKSNNNRKRGRPKVEMLAAKKEKIRKSQMTCAVDVSHLLQGSVFSEMVTDPVDAQKKKPPRVKSLSKRHSVELIKSSKLLAKNQESVKVSPVHSILKNQLRVNSSKKTSFKGDSQSDNLIKGRCESEKHVTFSGKDDILGHNECSPIELPQFQSLCKIFSNVLAVSSAMKDANNGDKVAVSNERAQVTKASANDTTATVIDGTIRSSSEKKQSTDANCHANFPINLNNRNNLDTEKASLGVTIDLNYAIESSCDLNCLNPDVSALSPRDSYCGSSQILNSTYKEVLTSDSGYQAESCTRMSNSKSLPVPMGICVSRSDSTSPLTTTRNLVPQHMVSCSITSMQANESQQHRSIEPKIDSFMHIQEYQPVYNISPRDLMSGICSLVGTKKHAELRPVPDQLSICGDKHNAENFIGLPLNSQGELINSQSTGNFDFSDLFRKQNTLLGSDCSSPVPTLAAPKNRLDQTKMKEQLPGALNDRLNWFPEPANKSIAPCFDINELQDSEEIEVQDHESVRDTDASFQQDPNLMRASCHGCKVDNQTHNWIDSGKFQADRNLDHRTRPATQRTIHLMGKYVTVGRNSNDCHGFDDRKIWTDKEIIIEQCPEPLNMRCPQQVEAAHPASGTSRQNHLQSLEAPTSSCHIPAVEQHFDRMRFDGQRQWRSGNSLYSTIGSHGSKVHQSNHPLPLKVLLSKISKSVANSDSLSEYLEMGNQIPLVGSRPQNVSQQMLLGSTHSKCNQSLSCSTSSSSSSQFPDSHNGNFVEPPSAHSSSYLPKWLLNPKQQKKNQNISCPSNTVPMSIRHRCTKAGGNLLPLPSPYIPSIVSHLNDDNATSRRSSSTPASLVLPSFIPSHPASEFAPAVNPTNGKKVNIGDGKQSNFKYFKLLDRANITRKRHADKGIDFMRQVKKPSLTGHGLSNVLSGPNRREQLLECIPYGTVYPETPAYWNKAMDVDLMITNNEKNGFRTASGSSSLPPDGGSISGPVKLSAGAKHILKPSQNMDQDNSIPIHSTIPFALGTSSGKIPVSQMKAAQIYRF